MSSVVIFLVYRVTVVTENTLSQIFCFGFTFQATYFYDTLIPMYLSAMSLQWRYNERDGVSNHQPHDFVYSTVYSGADQRKHQSSASLAFVRGIHRWPVNSLHKGPVTRKVFQFDFTTSSRYVAFTFPLTLCGLGRPYVTTLPCPDLKLKVPACLSRDVNAMAADVLVV